MTKGNFTDTAQARGFGISGGGSVVEFKRIEDHKTLCVMVSVCGCQGEEEASGSLCSTASSEPNMVADRTLCRAACAMILEYATIGVHHLGAIRATLDSFGHRISFVIASISDAGEYFIALYSAVGSEDGSKNGPKDVAGSDCRVTICSPSKMASGDGLQIDYKVVDVEGGWKVKMARGVLPVNSMILLSAIIGYDAGIADNVVRSLQGGMEREDFILHTGLRSAVGAVPLVSSGSSVSSAHMDQSDSHGFAGDLLFAALHYRRSRKLLFCTGPPFNPNNDVKLCSRIAEWDGRILIAGGTTAQIVSRELGREISVNLRRDVSGLPPTSTMDGVDMITEGVLTLARLSALLERVSGADLVGQGIDYDVARMLIDSHDIEFLVGTRINVVHQDPNLPMELELRRNVIKRIGKIMESKFLRRVTITYL